MFFGLHGNVRRPNTGPRQQASDWPEACRGWSFGSRPPGRVAVLVVVLPAVYFCNRSWRLRSGSVAKDEIQEKTCSTCSFAPTDYSPTDNIAPQSPSRLWEPCSACPASAAAQYFGVRTSAPRPPASPPSHAISFSAKSQKWIGFPVNAFHALKSSRGAFHTQFLDSVLPPAGSGSIPPSGPNSVQ